MARPKLDMDHETYVKCLGVAAQFVKDGTQHELNLAGIGESTIHPRFVEYVHLAREAVGDECHLVLSTNGVNFPDEMIDAITSTNISIYVSPHRPERAARPIWKLHQNGLLRGLSEGAWTGSVDWAGQIDWPVTAGTTGTECPWVLNGRVTVFADGRVSTCCFDSDGSGVVGTVEDLIQGKALYVAPYHLCGPCHHEISDNLKSHSVEKVACL